MFFNKRFYKIKSDPKNCDKSEIRLFMNVRNEEKRLPFFFKYYREKGVDRFFIVDNDSNDSTQSFLKEQEDVHLFITKERYSKSNYGFNWIKRLLNKYGKGYWCLVVDADEFFVYPHFEELSIKGLCNILDKEKRNAVGALLLDSYSDKPLSLAYYKKDDDPFLIFPYFEKINYEMLSKRINGEFFGSKWQMRNRVFGVPAAISKYPLFKYSPKLHGFSAGMHSMSGANLSHITGALFHFKYSASFLSAVIAEAKRNEHWNNAVEYKKYAEVVCENPDIVIYSRKHSVKFQDSQQLIDKKIINSSLLLDECIGRKKGKKEVKA